MVTVFQKTDVGVALRWIFCGFLEQFNHAFHSAAFRLICKYGFEVSTVGVSDARQGNCCWLSTHFAAGWLHFLYCMWSHFEAMRSSKQFKHTAVSSIKWITEEWGERLCRSFAPVSFLQGLLGFWLSLFNLNGVLVRCRVLERSPSFTYTLSNA